MPTKLIKNSIYKINGSVIARYKGASVSADKFVESNAGYEFSAHGTTFVVGCSSIQTASKEEYTSYLAKP